MDTALRFEQTWLVGELIGAGGFGRVHAAHTPGTDAVAKFVPKSPEAERELLFVDLTGVDNAVPIIDSGETSDHWVLIMPRASKSLQDHLDAYAGPLDHAEAINILTDVASALVGLDSKGVVHRDLKPANILLLDGNWCVADFGIARYADKTTAIDTLKSSLTAAYAAPERWRLQRASTATDVYSFGVIAFQLFAGRLPFNGPDFDDFREQHLGSDPESLNTLPAPLASLIAECLWKAPGATPTPGNILTRLQRLEQEQKSLGLLKLEIANRAEVSRRAEADAELSRQKTAQERRDDLYTAAVQSFRIISSSLLDTVKLAAPTAVLDRSYTAGWSLTLNTGTLRLGGVNRTINLPWEDWDPPAFEVIAHTDLAVTSSRSRYGYEGRGHSLWFCDARRPGQFGWYETAFMDHALTSKPSPPINPFALAPGLRGAKALWRGHSEFMVARAFEQLVPGELEEFIDRWASLFASAAEGSIPHPHTLPEGQPQGSWR